ncbi:hypothetical protein [Streptomyces sp. NPDC055912]|uniref:hypothetical protein n=1 Tax=Streptomyces sp. NPDC055912 TaxID=3345660 RepID=UPI0035E0A0AB
MTGAHPSFSAEDAEQRLRHLNVWCRALLRREASARGLSLNVFLDTNRRLAEGYLRGIAAGLGMGTHIVAAFVEADDKDLFGVMTTDGTTMSGEVMHLATLILASHGSPDPVFVTARTKHVDGPDTVQVWHIVAGRAQPVAAQTATGEAAPDGAVHVDAFTPKPLLGR